MASLAHCAFCFETLAANLEHRKSLSLQQVEELWAQYASQEAALDKGDSDTVDGTTEQGKPAAVSRLLNPVKSSTPPSSSSSSSVATSTSSTPAPASSKSSSLSSLFKVGDTEPSHPLFITWNTLSRSGHKSLRGCIGTFEPLPITTGLHNYALTAALEDHRFNPIPLSLIPSLQVCVTLLTNFSQPDSDPLNWTVGEHGIRLYFFERGRRYSATYLPDVAKEQGWTREEAVVSLMKKAGWHGRPEDWRKVGRLEIVRYEGKKVSLDYAAWKEWRDWASRSRRLS